MRCKFRGVHTLNSGDAITKIPGMGYKHRIFKNISATAQPAKEKIGGLASEGRDMYNQAKDKATSAANTMKADVRSGMNS